MTHQTQNQQQKSKAPAQASCKASFESQSKAKAVTTNSDRRFSVAREFCGYATAQFVARFCGLWIGCAATKMQARELANQFNATRI